MTKRTTLPGFCFSCEKPYDKRGMGRHLKSCAARKEAIATEYGDKTRLLHLRIEDPYDPAYWLDIEMAANATLAELDQFLRDIWLECCGHLSQFIIGDREIFYSSYIDPDPFFGSWKTEEYDLLVAIGKALPVNKKIQYEYDFGSTTELSVEIIAERKGSLPRGKKLRILSRNFSPLYDCSICGEEPAQWINVFEYEDNLYCDRHAKEHDDWSEGFLPLSNSPRAGVCGYEGTEIKEYEFERFV